MFHMSPLLYKQPAPVIFRRLFITILLDKDFPSAMSGNIIPFSPSQTIEDNWYDVNVRHRGKKEEGEIY